MLPFYLLSVPVVISVVLLMGDSLRRRGLFTTFVIFGIGFLFFAAKENLQMYHLLIRHEYLTTRHAFLYIHLVPIGIILGHLFTINVTWTLAERILARNRVTENMFFQTIILAMAITSALAYAMEITGTSAEWWVWAPPDRATPYAIQVPPAPMLGWTGFVFGLLVPYYFADLMGKPRSTKAKLGLILGGYLLFYALLFKDILSFLIGIAIFAWFMGAVFSRRRIAKPLPPRNDKKLQNLPKSFGWIFDHALEISIVLNWFVIATAMAFRADSPVLLLPLVAWFCYCAIAILRLPIPFAIVVVAILGLVGMADEYSRVAFALLSLNMGFFILMAPYASKTWKVILVIFVATCIVTTVFDLAYILRVVPLVFAGMVLWYFAGKQRSIAKA